jgi:D-3-phosphoglycerate dehydrogenase / 2-oxoglutarate reductase
MKILIVDEMHDSLFEMLNKNGLSYRYEPNFNRADILKNIPDYEGLIIRSKTSIDTLFLQQAQKLRFIARAGAGLDLIDTEAAKNKNIQVFAANEGNQDAVAEHTLALILCLLTNLVKANAEVKQGIWKREENRGFELMNKTVGLIGFGFNGKATAQRLSGFGCRVLVYDKYLSNYGNAHAAEAPMQQIFEEADILSLHIPLTDETKNLVSQEFIAQFSKPFYLFNISRGEIVNLDAVVSALKTKKILGAGLDVLENEKINSLSLPQKVIFDYLCQSDNVILTPHIAGWTHESYVKINDVMVRQITNFLK